MATYIHDRAEYVAAVHTKVKELDPEVDTLPTNEMLETYWQHYNSVEKAAQDWIDYWHS